MAAISLRFRYIYLSKRKNLKISCCYQNVAHANLLDDACVTNIIKEKREIHLNITNYPLSYDVG